MATYAIGDVQGCCSELEALLDKVAFAPGRDKLWLVGDLVNRGPQSLEVLRLVKSLGACTVTVLGNHDLHLIAVAAGCAKPGRSDTLRSILEAPDRAELIDWLRTRPLAHAEAGYLMVHAGVLPQWSSEDVVRLAGEVGAALAAPSYASFLAQMYGDEPRAWNDKLKGMDRLRVIVNALTRMRFATRSGEIELEQKGGPDRAPKGFRPWFDVPERKTAGVTMVCGHWSALGFVQRPDLIALDSGCVWGGCLTAVRLEDRQVTQMACEQPAD